MKKIEIIDCLNTDHKIALIISERCKCFEADVYFALEKHEGLSNRQIKQLEDFCKSCPGPIMVDGYYFGQNNARWLAPHYPNGSWCYYAYEAKGFVFVHYSTSVFADRCYAIKVAKDMYKGMDWIEHDLDKWAIDGYSSLVWQGRRILNN